MEIERTIYKYDYMEYFSTAAAMTQKDDVASAFLGSKFKFFSLSFLLTSNFFKMVSNHCVYFLFKLKFISVMSVMLKISLRIMLMPREQVP